MSDRIRFALIIGLAITTAYAIALSMNWEKPYWAGLAVAMISLSTVGESVFKGLQRLAGTIVAIFITLALVSTFPQHRWAFAGVVSLWLAFCTYRTQRSTNYYFWFCSGFTVVLLSMMSSFDPEVSFYVVVERAKETMLGVLCFVVYASLLSQRPARHAFHVLIARQCGLLHQRAAAIREHAETARSDGARPELAAEIAHGQSALPALQVSTTVESFGMRERKASWARFIAKSGRLAQQLESLDHSLSGAGTASVAIADPEMATAVAEIEARIAEVASILANGRSVRLPKPLALAPDNPLGNRTPMPVASPFAAGAHLLRRDILSELDRTTGNLHDLALDIVDLRRRRHTSMSAQDAATLLPDPEFVRRSLTQFCGFWMVFLMYIYAPALPDGPVVLMLVASLGMNIARMPWVAPIALIVPVLVSILFVAVAHIFILPHLVGFAQLGALLLLSTFALGWLFHSDKLQAGRALSLAIFVTALQISNDNQQFSATYILNMFVAIVLVLLFLTLASRVPVSWRPQDVVQRLLRAYSRYFDALLRGMRWDAPQANGWLANQRSAFLVGQLETLPREIAIWADRLPANVAGESERATLRALADQLGVLGNHARHLARLRSVAGHTALVPALVPEISAWRERILAVVGTLATSPARLDIEDLNRQLADRVRSLEHSVEAAVAERDIEGVAPPDIARMHRVLAAFRAVSSALIGVVRRAQAVSWPHLMETRF